MVKSFFYAAVALLMLFAFIKKKWRDAQSAKRQARKKVS
jgi:hypothetical protein